MNRNYEYEKALWRRKMIIICAMRLQLAKRNSKKRWYVRPIFQERRNLGHHTLLVEEYKLNNSAKFYNFMRMSSSNFEDLLSMVGLLVYRIPTRPDVLSPGEILSATIRYLASGDSMSSIMYAFRIGESTVSIIVRECCLAIWKVLKIKVLFTPSTQGWIQIANEFHNNWNMPNCIGAMDGKHVVHQAFANTGSVYYNYKGSHSIVLLAVCDADYNYLLVDIGAPGRNSDGGVFRQSTLGKKIINNDIKFPNPPTSVRQIKPGSQMY
ncbi:protein ANTAGONIST OF LIKE HETEROCHROMATIN PROTEIN 1-like [Acyrthosiphon pisum]|uniref:DDE Tnp4 domain-containing protein n=1 Tax=Acyrthosiphon pisum TaxID=7029 RepID=A0A8R2H5H5_ACYPI|nr:protein ANTAGONIST OF LIKE HETEROCHROMATIN PROTEIN 1-like [Acyrthosiphon pisum]|eukprot:XP_016656399.1 PREDICTED: putative nuclease HARBI1 [Acyrthosiphon pisum]